MQLASIIDGASATVIYDEDDIRRRGAIVDALKATITKTLITINPAVRMIQVETPTLLPMASLAGHRAVGFELCDVPMHDQTLTLRPETTHGTLAMLDVLCPQKDALKKRLPLCIWQVGKAYRNEQIRPLAEIRFREFYQCEFQLVVSEGSKAEYFDAMAWAAYDIVNEIVAGADHLFSIVDVESNNLAHYSLRTKDLFYGDIEIGAISERTDLKERGLLLYEASFGLDRLTKLCRW